MTIGRDASLVVNSGATVISIATTELSHRMNTTKIPPSLIVTGNGNLTVNGSLDSSIFTVNQDASLRGSGTVSSDWMTIKSVSCLKNSDVTIQSVLCTIEGSGTIDTLKLNNAEIRLNSGESGVVINNVISSSSAGGESSLSCATGMTLGTISISGTLTLRSVSFYGDETVTSTLSGAVTGDTLLLDSGIYQLKTGFSCTSTQDYGHVIVYDYVGNSDCLTAPLLVAPSKAKAALDAVKSGQNEDGTLYYDVPIVVVSASQSYRLNGGVFTMEGFEATSADTSLRITTDKEGIALQDFHRGFQHTITENTTELVYELEYFDESKIFHTVILKEDDISKLDESFNPGFPLKNLYLIRVTKLTTDGSGQGGGTATSTSTSYTGSGVLGGTGAGSITIGGITYDLSSAKDYDPTPDPGPAPNPDPSPDPGPLPKPDPTPEPDPKPDPLVVTIEEAPVETPLVWAEVAPAVSNDAVSPTETQYVVLALEGEKTLKELGGRATVLMSYTPPAEYAGKPLFVVFRNEDGTLTAIRATYSNITGLLRFITDRLGTFMVVGFNFDGEEFSEEFYEALSRLTVLEKLEFAEYSQI